MTLQRHSLLYLLLNGLLVDVHDMILARAQTYGLGVVDGVGAVLLVNAVQQVGGVVLGGHLLVVDDVHTGLVKGHGVGGSQDAIVLKFHRSWMVDAVAVDAHVVHHADVDDALLLVEVVRNSLSSGSHALKESVLVADEFGCPKLGHIEFLHFTR